MNGLEERHDDTAPLLGAYVLNAVEADERERVVLHLSECGECSTEVAGHREVVELLLNSDATPPEHLWDQVIGKVEGEPPLLRALPPLSGATSRAGGSWASGRTSQLLSAIVATAAAVTAVFSVSLAQSANRLGDLEQRLAQGSVQQAAQAADTDPTNVHMTMVSGDGRYAVDAVLAENRRGFLVDGQLPDLPEGEAYQLWSLGGAQPVSLGMIGKEVEPTAFVLPPGASGLAITRERATGAVAPSGLPVVNTPRDA